MRFKLHLFKGGVLNNVGKYFRITVGKPWRHVKRMGIRQ